MRQVVFIGAGSGITPLFSILKSILIVEPESEVFLIYGNRNEESVIFDQKLAALEVKYGPRLTIVYSLSKPSSAWGSNTGRLEKENLLTIMEGIPALKVKEAEYFLCGPYTMMEEAQLALKHLDVSEDKIRKESFSTVVPTHPHDVNGNSEDLKTRVITLIYEGTEYKLPVEPHETVLEAALNLDIDLPYSCQAGMCTACLGKCLSGKVVLDEEDALTELELKDGLILTCVSRPMSDDVIIEVE